jgi:hypothetical protein
MTRPAIPGKCRDPPRDRLLADEAQKRFVDDRRRLEGVAAAFATQLLPPSRGPSQLEVSPSPGALRAVSGRLASWQTQASQYLRPRGRVAGVQYC